MSIKWNKELILEVANSCSTKSEFTKNYGGAYNAAKRLNIFEEVCKCFNMSRTYWSEEQIVKEALKYSNKQEFKQGSRGAYEAAVRRDIKKFIGHMKPLRESWDLDKAFAAAKQYNYRGDFLSNCSGAYHFLSKLNKLDLACQHMWTSSDTIKWCEDTIKKEATKYNTRNTFKHSSSGAYQAMLKLGITDKVCLHMDLPKCVKYTYEQLSQEALKYTTKSEFKRNSYGPYQAACRHAEFDQMTSHMEDASKFSMLKPSILYYFKIWLEDVPIWKIGVTNYSVEDRYYRRDIDRMEDILEIQLTSGAEAYAAEQTIIKTYKEFKYSGPTPFTDGTGITECFKHDISKEEFFISTRKLDASGNPLE